MSSLSVYTRFENLPKNLKQDVSDFIDFLLGKNLHLKRKRWFRNSLALKGKYICPQNLMNHWKILNR